MNYLLSVLMCSTIANTCLPPHTFEDIYDSSYTCLIDGYQKSINKLEEIGQSEVDEHGIYIKFECIQMIVPKPKPKTYGEKEALQPIFSHNHTIVDNT